VLEEDAIVYFVYIYVFIIAVIAAIAILFQKIHCTDRTCHSYYSLVYVTLNMACCDAEF
jgi:hypothetical protein